MRILLRIVAVPLLGWGLFLLLMPVWNFFLSMTGIRLADASETLMPGLLSFGAGIAFWLLPSLGKRFVRRPKEQV
ncbi:hypothetical protein [Brevundimonas sp.]|uniref:hypothetical protein n=1 Tax=Brevundimonas sp. TaxID=1871086 RepID=UPI003563CACB